MAVEPVAFEEYQYKFEKWRLGNWMCWMLRFNLTSSRGHRAIASRLYPAILRVFIPSESIGNGD